MNHAAETIATIGFLISHSSHGDYFLYHWLYHQFRHRQMVGKCDKICHDLAELTRRDAILRKIGILGCAGNAGGTVEVGLPP